MIQIRDETPADVDDVRHVNEAAFGQPDEARLVDLVRANGGVLLSLVATLDARVVGHVLYSPVRLDTSAGALHGAGLAPMAVLPEFQRTGIGGG